MCFTFLRTSISQILLFSVINFIYYVKDKMFDNECCTKKNTANERCIVHNVCGKTNSKGNEKK